MRRLLFLVGVALCVACGRTPGYKVSGTIEGAQDGDTVKMFVYEGWSTVVLDETLVKNGAFEFTGRQDTAVFRHIACVARGKNLGCVRFVLENGDIRLSLKEGFDYDIKGTPLNEVWCVYHNENERLCGESMDLYRALQDTTQTDEVRAQKQAASKAKEKEIKDFRMRFCKENIGNVAGADVLALNYKDFEWDDVLSLLAQVPETCTDPAVLTLKEEVASKQKTAVGQPFTDFAMQTPDGKELHVSDVAKTAKVTMIDFWASWCGPCRAEMPYVKAAYEKYHDRGFEIIGVSLDNDAEAWKKAIEAWQLPWPQVSDLKGWQSQGAALYGVTAIPATVLLQDGKIVARNLREEAVAEKLAELLE